MTISPPLEVLGNSAQCYHPVTLPVVKIIIFMSKGLIQPTGTPTYFVTKDKRVSSDSALCVRQDCVSLKTPDRNKWPHYQMAPAGALMVTPPAWLLYASQELNLCAQNSDPAPASTSVSWLCFRS